MEKKQQTQEKILNAALMEFAINGFDLASTNTICKNAGTSKGTIFKYFPTKTILFYAVFNRELDKMVTESLQIKYAKDDDPFVKISTLLIWKIEYSQNHPEATKVLSLGIAKPPQPQDTLVLSKLSKLADLSIERFFGDLSMDNIREGLSQQDVKKTLQIAVAGLQSVYVNNHPEFPFSKTAREECMRYLKIIYRGMEKPHE